MTHPAKDEEALVRAVSEELQLAGCPAPDPDAAYAEKQRDFEDFARAAIAAVRAYDAESLREISRDVMERSTAVRRHLAAAKPDGDPE